MSSTMARPGTLAIDVGGTFTDITYADAATGATWVAKTPSTPSDLSRGFITAVRKVLGQAGRTPPDVLRVFHGTTTATNAILEGKTPPTALVTTTGFKFVLEIGRHDIPRHGNLYGWSKPARPVTPDHVHEVTERLDADGSVLTPLDEAEARQVARRLAQAGVPAVAVVFLHAYANPAHERRMAAILAEEYPGVLVSLSSEVLPQFREFERSMATALNAAVMPPVSRYVGLLRAALDAEGVRAPLLIMKSDGGVTSAATCVRQPVQTVLSGPSAGVVGAVSVARTAGHRDIISIDVGGTSADICLVRDGRPEITKDGMIGPFPLKLPMVDIHTIGAGGGSIATVSASGRLTVGPRSAGAEPGPVCYGRGGLEPTVTDAHLVLGRIPPALLGGEIPLDLPAARAALAERVGAALRLTVEEAAAGVVEIIDNSMARAIRTVSVGRGHDPRRFALVAFGGAGPLHACRLAELLAIPTVIVPPRPGVLSTWGLLDTDIRATFVRTVGPDDRRATGDAAAPRLEGVWRELEAQARAWLDGEEVPRERQRFERAADLRYEHQSFELTCAAGDGPVTAAMLSGLVATFHAEHRRLYTYDLPRAPIELVNLRVTAIGALPRRGEAGAAGAAATRDAKTGERRVYFRGAGWLVTPSYDRARLRDGQEIVGPAVIEQDDATPLVAPGFAARVDAAGNLLLERVHA
jgi:N-methylhydantoinase A